MNKENGSEMENLGETCLKISQAFLAWLILIILSPLLIVTFGLLLVWKHGVLWVIVKLFKRKFIQGFHSSETLFAIDRYWESSRSSLGLLIELEGALNIDVFRDEFRKKILELSDNDNASSPKPFAKLMQIPTTFGGYYFWQKANYFLIHEHIRQINQPTDELGLKKAVGTLMTLPFPNRRPLWEILVYSNYLGTTTVGRGTTCGSALFIRLHRSVTDSQGLMNLLQQMMTDQTIKSVYVTSPNDEGEKGQGVTISKGAEGISSIILIKLKTLVFLPFRGFQFAQDVIRVRQGLVQSEGEWESASASWVTLSEVTVRKICSSQLPNLSSSAVELCLFLEGITNGHKCPNVPEEKGVDTQEGKCQTCVLVPVPKPSVSSQENLLPNDQCFTTVKCPCISSCGSTKATVLKAIHQIESRKREETNQIFSIYLHLLSLLPRHVLRYLVSKKWGACCLLYEQFSSDMQGFEKLDREEHKIFGKYQVSQIVPFVGLQWPHTVASACSLKWQGNISLSLVANAGILSPMSQATSQENVERIVKGFPDELDRLADDVEDHGFVSIPIS